MTGKKVLLYVDDDSSDIELFKLAFSALPLEIELMTFTDPVNAFEFCLEIATAPNLIILDYNMHGMTGIQLFENLKRIEMLNKTPVAFLSTAIDSISQSEALAMGAVAYFQKPFVFSGWIPLIQQIAKLLRDFGSNPPPAFAAPS